MHTIEEPLKTELRQRVGLGSSKELLGARLASDVAQAISPGGILSCTIIVFKNIDTLSVFLYYALNTIIRKIQ